VENNKSRLFVFSAPSGSGKTTIVKDVLKNYPHFVFSISATTRAKRPAETNGIDYFFVNEKEFQRKVDTDEFIEWEKVYEYYYGTVKSQIDANIQNGLNTVFEVDVIGAFKIKRYYSNSVLIFIAPPGIEELKERLIKRNTETGEDLKMRIERAEMELSVKDKFDYIVSNVDLEEAKKEVKKIIDKEITKEV
jgi:guanylate kinase